jgi:hypothetical protein
MKYILLYAVAASAALIGTLIAANAKIIAWPLPTQVSTCATGFTHVAIDADTYACWTPIIKCPPRTGMLSFTQALPTVNSSAGSQFKYRCKYQKPLP